MTTCRYGDVVLVTFPFTNLQTTMICTLNLLADCRFAPNPPYAMILIISEVEHCPIIDAILLRPRRMNCSVELTCS